MKNRRQLRNYASKRLHQAQAFQVYEFTLPKIHHTQVTYITGSTLKSQLQLPVPQYIYGDASAHCWAQRERTHADTLTNTHTNYLHKTTRRERMRRIESLIAIIIITHSMSTKAAITIISCLMQILVRTSLQTIL